MGLNARDAVKAFAQVDLREGDAQRGRRDAHARFDALPVGGLGRVLIAGDDGPARGIDLRRGQKDIRREESCVRKIKRHDDRSFEGTPRRVRRMIERKVRHRPIRASAAAYMGSVCVFIGSSIAAKGGKVNGAKAFFSMEMKRGQREESRKGKKQFGWRKRAQRTERCLKGETRAAGRKPEKRKSSSDGGSAHSALFGRKRAVLAHTLVQFPLDNSQHQCYNSKLGH